MRHMQCDRFPEAVTPGRHWEIYGPVGYHPIDLCKS